MKNQVSTDESFKPKLVFQNHNSWNHRLDLNEEAQFSINLILKDKI